MKNRFLFFGFVFLSLFLCVGNVSAKTKVGINIDTNEHFNYYYEQRESTSFYDLIRNLSLSNNNVYDYYNLSSIDSSNYNLYAFYASDLESAEIKKYNSNNTNNHWYQDVEIPIKAFYAIYFVYSSVSGNDLAPVINIDNNTYSINYKSWPKNTNYYNSQSYKSILRFYDNEGNYISSASDIYFNYNASYTFDGYDDKSSSDFTYMISSCISCSYKFNLSNKTIVVTDIIEDNTHYLIDDNENYSGWLRKLFSFGKLKYSSVVDTDLNYFKTNIIENNLPSIAEIIKQGIRSIVPDSFLKVSLGDDINNYIFIPKSINDNTLNRKFFASTNESIHYNLFKVGYNAYEISNNFKPPYEESNLSLVGFLQPLQTYQVDVNKPLKKLNENYSVTDFAIGFGLFGNSVKYSADIYYNPDAYSICDFDLDDNKSCSYVNPITGENAVLTHQQMYDILSQNDTLGVSVRIDKNWTDKEYCKTVAEYSELYDYDENCNIIGLHQSGGVENVIKSLGDIKTFITGFVGVITTLLSFMTILFNSLPTEISTILLFGLIGGVVLVIYKLIRG